MVITRNQFIEYLNHPEKLNGHSIDALEKLVKEYPYFQLGRMLYLKNLHNQNSIDYEKNLHITSAYAPSGKVLYNLIKKKAEKKVEVKSEKLEVIQPVVNENQKEVLPKLEPIAILQEMSMSAKESEVVNPPKDEFDELEVLEKEMVREAYRTSMTIDLLEEQEAKSQKPKIAVQPEALNFKPETATYSFGDWMKVVSGQAPESVKQEKAIQKKAKTDIIENFILDQTAKSAPKPKAEFYSAENMAKKSVQDNETFVSETLAKIYLNQGNLPKALRSYEILLVKHPEKLHIFAPLLEKIKKLLEDQKAK